MSGSLPQSRLEIEVKDFGPIVHAKFDLRPMTVFIGPSNTGKSYLAILTYALHRFFGGVNQPPPGMRRVGLWRSRLGSAVPEPTEEVIAAYVQLAQTVADGSPRREAGRIALPDIIVELLRSEFNESASAMGSEILRCFGMDATRSLVRRGRSERANVVVRHNSLYNADLLEHQLLIGPQTAELHCEVPNCLHIPSTGVDMQSLHYNLDNIRFHLQDIDAASEQPENDEWPFAYLSVTSSLMDLVLHQMFGNLDLRAFYLPADRTGVMHAHSAVVSAVVDSAPMAGLRPVARTPLLSGVLADFLSQLIRIDQSPIWGTTRRPTSGPESGRQMEKNILRGAIGVEHSELINYPHFTYRPDGWKEDLPLMHASSMVSELAPVVLYLRHLVQPGNVLIIEEPESHLHPAMQVEFMRQLAKLVQAGYRVVITTHSEWILEELANVVQRSQLPPEELSTVSVSDAALTTDQVGVWLFRNKARPRGSEVVHVPLGESGLYDSGFDDVAIALSNDGASIFNRIGRNE